MSNQYRTLSHRLLSSSATIDQGVGRQPQQITLNDNAQAVMTGFESCRPLAISATATLDETNKMMILAGVRLLFVTDADDVLQGLVTYTDIFGEKAIQYLSEHGGSREDIVIRDIMTPLLQLEALSREDVAKATVGDIVETIQAAGRQHMLVTDRGRADVEVITGIFSSTHIEKLLGIKIELSPRANTFTDLERALT